MKVLILCGEIPYPPQGGSRMRVYQFIRVLRERHDITLLAYQYSDDESVNIQTLRKFCRAETVRWQEPPQLTALRSGNIFASRAAHLRGLGFDATPFVVQYFRSTQMSARLNHLLERERFDILHVEDTAMMSLVPKKTRVPVLLSIQNVEYWLEARARNHSWGQKIEVMKLRQYEGRAFRRARMCCPTSEIEAEKIRRLVPTARIQLVPNGVDTREFLPGGSKSTRPTVMFTGTLSYAPNAEAIEWFVREVWSIVLERIPEAVLYVVGREPPEKIRALANECIIVTGNVPDVRPYLQRAWIAVAPLLHGGGTRLKILEAMACALPVVSTTIAAEGLNLAPGENIVVADDARAFADQMIRLLGDETARAVLGARGRTLVEREYDWRESTGRLEQAYLKLAH